MGPRGHIGPIRPISPMRSHQEWNPSMIPRRIKLSGFLPYKDEQEIAFDGSSLWMLSGFNGSGKSTIFDAVTYALFGHHRGGATNAGELINKESKGLGVEFEFLAEGQPFQVRRTLRRDARGAP